MAGSLVIWRSRYLMRSTNVSEISIKRLSLTIDITDKNWWKLIKIDENRNSQLFWSSIFIDFRYQSINCYRLLSITIDFIDYRISSIGHAGVECNHLTYKSSNSLHKIKIYKSTYLVVNIGRHGGLMVSALDSTSSSPGSSPGRGQCCVLEQDTLLSHCLSTQVYKWVPTNLLLGVNPAMD